MRNLINKLYRWKRKGCKYIAAIIFIMAFLPYVPPPIVSKAVEHSVVYNTTPAHHYDGSVFRTGQWYGYYLVGGFLSQRESSDTIWEWEKAYIPASIGISLTNFTIPDVGVKLKTAAFCLRPKAPNWPAEIRAYEITPEICNEFTDITEHQIDERDIDALNVAMETLGLNKNAVNFSNETYATMRFVTWYVGHLGWKSKSQFLAGIDEVKFLLDNNLVNQSKFLSLCNKVADNIEKSIGAPDTGYTEYMPAFAGRYSNLVPVITFTDDDNDGVFTYQYTYSRKYDSSWEYSCPSGITVEYSSNSVTFKSNVSNPSGMIEGTIRPGSKLEGVVPAGGILVSKSDDPEAQDMLIPYSSSADLTCYAKAKGGENGSSKSEFPTLPDVEFYQYDETFQANYSIDGEKIDSETNQKLKGAEFEIIEACPTVQPSILDNYWGSEIDTWNDWKQCKRVETNENGYFSHRDTHTYDYIGTYCGGHDEQMQTINDYIDFIKQCEEENAEAEEGGDDGSGGGGGDADTEEDAEPKWDTEAMQIHLETLEQGYQEQLAACDDFASDSLNHFFHSETGTDGQKSDLEHDKQNAYDQFVNLEYDYTVREIRTRSGYLFHGKHTDDHPIPVIRTASSESGKSGYVINPDNTTAGLPAVFEGATTTKAVISLEGNLTMADSYKKEDPREEVRQNQEATPSGAGKIIGDAEEIASPSVPMIKKQALFSMGWMASKPEKKNKEKNIFQSMDTSMFADQTTETNSIKETNILPQEEESMPDIEEELELELESELEKATPSDAQDQSFSFYSPSPRSADPGDEPYTVADWEPDWQSGNVGSTNTGLSDRISFTWYIYNHRIEGEVQINKRDMELLAGENRDVDYASYGDSQGDAVLEGAVYGLYAAQNIVHPDGKTGTIFSANELVSIATTDINGDASFLTITEESPISKDLENNYDGTYTDTNNPTSGTYPDYKQLNGNQWIGRPLMLGRYYVKEIGRSEGYELSITGNDDTLDTNFGTTGQTMANQGSAYVDSIMAGGGNSGTSGSMIQVKTENAVNGVELYLYNYPKNTKFGIMRTGMAAKPGQSIAGWNDKLTYLETSGKHVYRNDSGSGKAFYRWDYNSANEKYVWYETDHAAPLYEQYRAGDLKKDSDGNYIPVRNNLGEIQYTTIPESKSVKYMNYKTTAYADVVIPVDITNVRNTANKLLKDAGYYMIVTAASKGSWFKMELTGTTEQEQTEEILRWYKERAFYNSAQVQSVTKEGGKIYAMLRYDYITSGSSPAVLYTDVLYLKEMIPGGNGLYYYVPYQKGEYTLDSSKGIVTIHAVKKIDVAIDMDDVIEDHIKPMFIPKYEVYSQDTVITDQKGDPVQVIESVPEISENTNVTTTKTMDYLTDTAEYDDTRKCFKIVIRGERLNEEEKNGLLRIESEHPGMGKVQVNGQTLQLGEYLKYVLDITAFASVPSEDWSGTYIKDVLLPYDSSRKPLEDGETRTHPVSVQERVIKQPIKVTKDIIVNQDGTYDNNTNAIHDDWFTENFGGLIDWITGNHNQAATEMDNFKFKAYLKSNLLDLYRNEDGQIVWLDRAGEEVDIAAFRRHFPAKAQQIYTKVPHVTDLIYKDSDDAVIANKELYSIRNGFLQDLQNPGYTRLLETVTEQVTDVGGQTRQLDAWNYEKFFAAISTVNTDKWDNPDGNVSNSSGKPPASNGGVNNEINTSEEAKQNALASDAVCQFAIDWYLEEEIKKLVKNTGSEEDKEDISGGGKYSDEVYDKALFQAIAKTNNYLTPFFSYDLDAIYSIEWDGATDGGNDKDTTTLSADTIYQNADGNSYYYGTSEALPYGTYVTVEQQPWDHEQLEFKNKHYRIDEPKEVVLPTIYEVGKPEDLHPAYVYDSSLTPEEMLNRYHIRFNEEWDARYEDRKNQYIAIADGYHSSYEIYKYGLDLDQRIGHFDLEQGEYKPYKDHYRFTDDGVNLFYLPNRIISTYYRYASVSEQAGIANDVIFPDAGDKEKIRFKDQVKTMQGVQTAYEGKYASMLVPWSVTEPDDSDLYLPDEFKGYADTPFHNTFFTTKLRIEKLDSETGENILHDGAIFAFYAASREDGEDTEGRVLFYEKDTQIKGSKEFLESMGASQINPLKKGMPGETYSGWAAAGTPICKESEQIILSDEKGNKTGQFKAYTTTRDGLQADKKDQSKTSTQSQNAGYIETPQPIGAGVYVLAEIKSTAGYTRTKPIAIEVYSDKVSYYLDGDRDNRVTATVYEDKLTNIIPDQEGIIKDTARIYVNNTPIRLEVSKAKTKDNTATYKTDTRVEGTELELKARYGIENLEFAYNQSGKYLGYAWYKGTLEYLLSRKEAGEQVEIVYQAGIFAGYGLITRPLDTADDANKTVAGATMTLYDAIEINKNGNTQDFAYDGLLVTRDNNSNVKSIKVQKGYAGTSVKFVQEKINDDNLISTDTGTIVDNNYTYDDEINDTGNGNWSYKTIQRETTEILFYSLGGLKVTETDQDGIVYGYNREGRKIQVKGQSSIYALKNGRPEFEITGGDLTHVEYSSLDKCFKSLDKTTRIYHLDRKGNRDSSVDPGTGMAYVIQSMVDHDGTVKEKTLVWPVNVSETANGAVIAREKIKTHRIATINADTDQEYVTGTYNGTRLDKKLNPVLDKYGLPEYYQRSDHTYQKGQPIYDIDHDYVRYKYFDLLLPFNLASYSIDNRKELSDIGKEEDITDDQPLYYRQGESYVMENTWVSGENTPNDPFKSDLTLGQPDVLKRVIPGTYIMEEVEAPSGYALAFPMGVTVEESAVIQKVEMTDDKIKAEIVKTDAPDTYQLDIISDYQDVKTAVENKGAYGYGQIIGSHLALYKAQKVYTTDSENYPEGFYLIKAETTPAQWTVENTTDNQPVTITAEWVSDGTPMYFEGIPAGYYILEESEATSGYIRNTMDLEIKPTGETQTFNLKNDHTKLEVFKYWKDTNGILAVLPGAELALYEAIADANGNIIYEEGKPKYDDAKEIDRWVSDDVSQYTELTDKNKNRNWITRIVGFLGIRDTSSFITDFEAAYKKQGNLLQSLSWHTKAGERTADLTSSKQADKTDSVVQMWRTDTGSDIRITIYRNIKNGSLDENGKLPLIFEYQFNYKELGNGMKSYDTMTAKHRIDYLPFTAIKEGKPTGNYVLKEISTPGGFELADEKALVITETGDIQRFSLENEEKFIHIDKKVTTTGSDGNVAEYPVSGVTLALYRAAEDGSYDPDNSCKVETWVTGSDGIYTDEDKFQGKILPGYRVGDLRPHRISKIPYGIYYITEIEVPDYMVKNPPQKIEVKAEKVTCYHVINHIAKGKIEILKKASDDGTLLGNARFEVVNEDTKATYSMTTDTSGKASLENLPVGKVGTDGTIVPYTYSIREVSPPEYYQISIGIKKFQFDGSSNEETLTFTYELTNAPTKIRFTKTNFDTDMFVAGAVIAIYQAKAVDGSYIKDGDAIETIVTGDSGFTITKKLIASHVYIAEELSAPDGMTLAGPLIFSLNASGTGIENVSNDFSIIKINQSEGYIDSLTVTGRVPVKVTIVMREIDGLGNITLVGTGSDQILTAADGLTEGNLYEIFETTQYSDGNTETSKKETRRIWFDDQGQYVLRSRSYQNTVNSLTNDAGKVIDSWVVDTNDYDHTIVNPVSKERIIAKVSGAAGKDGAAVKDSDIIKYEITYANLSDQVQDIEIKAVLNENLEYMRSVSGTELNGIVTWLIEDVKPYTKGVTEVVAAVKQKRGDAATADFTMSSGDLTVINHLSNPISGNGSITVINRLSGTGTEENDDFSCHVKLMDQNGKVLTGYYAYDGTETGRIKGEGTIALKGNGYIRFQWLPYGSRYEVTQKIRDGYELDQELISGQTGQYLTSAVFTNHKDDKSNREVLIANGNYTLTETTDYTDGSTLLSGKYQFTINENGVVDNIDMKDKPVKVYFSKQDIVTGEELLEGHYELIDNASDVVLFEFSMTGEKLLLPAELLVPGGTYRIREVQSPDGYHYAEDIIFTVDHSGVIETVIMQDEKTEVYFSKQDITTSEELKGGLYTVKEKDTGKTVLEYVATGEKQKVTGLLIAGQTYEFIEDLAPLGYAYTERVEFTVPKEAGVIRVVMKDKPTDVIIEKLIATSSDASRDFDQSEAGEQLPGFMLQILYEDGTPAKAVRTFGGYKEGEELIFTTTDSFTAVVKQLVADARYLLHEVKPRDGYGYAEDVPFTVSHDGRQDRVVMIDRPTHVVVSKKSITGSDELPGNHLSIKDEIGNTILSWISGEKPYEIIGVLTAGKKYFLHEVIPKDGYSYAAEVPFRVNMDGSIDNVTMYNEMTRVRIRKVDEAGKCLSGSMLQILDETRKTVIVPDFTTEETPYDITGRLTAGTTYYLHEIQAPEGYLLAADVSFTVPKEAGLIEVSMVDIKPAEPSEPGDNRMQLKKVDAETGKGLAGVEFTIYRTDGSKYKTVMTDGDGYADFNMPQAGTYTYQETKVPEGYLLSDQTYHFTIRNQTVTDDSVVVVSNHKAPDVQIEKVASDTDDILEGAEIEIRDEQGTVVFRGITGADGKISFCPSKPGIYQVTEVKAPDGYIKTSSFIHFTVSDSGTLDGTFTLYNNPKGGRKVGTVIAFYSSNMERENGVIRVKGNGIFEFLFGLPGTGDQTPFAWAAVLFAGSIIALGIIFKRGIYVKKNH